ncbi:hypothetical protein QE152_g26187 [Popillia japonica]|uniref:Transposable element P transposase-like RNase H domain-containing protein n=1 Tax=Popillia japonica TaxID=7064 RepID=A0AAW1JYT9_POPJA
MTEEAKDCILAGLSEFVCKVAEAKIATMTEEAKDCILCIDEMTLKTFLFYHRSKDTIIGFHETMQRSYVPANNAIVLMDQAWDRVQNSFNSRGLACRSIEQLKAQNSFNSRGLACRSIEQLKAKYDNLKSKARKCITVDTNFNTSMQEPKGNITPKTTLKRSGWSKYVPTKLKETVSKKLRPTVPTPLCQIKEDYYRLKIEYIKGELDEQKNKTILLKRELELKELEYSKKEERDIKEEKRRDEEHKRKIKLLDLKIMKQERDLSKI